MGNSSGSENPKARSETSIRDGTLTGKELRQMERRFPEDCLYTGKVCVSTQITVREATPSKKGSTSSSSDTLEEVKEISKIANGRGKVEGSTFLAEGEWERGVFSKGTFFLTNPERRIEKYGSLFLPHNTPPSDIVFPPKEARTERMYGIFRENLYARISDFAVVAPDIFEGVCIYRDGSVYVGDMTYCNGAFSPHGKGIYLTKTRIMRNRWNHGKILMNTDEPVLETMICKITSKSKLQGSTDSGFPMGASYPEVAASGDDVDIHVLIQRNRDPSPPSSKKVEKDQSEDKSQRKYEYDIFWVNSSGDKTLVTTKILE